jgi:hypothetical protein
MSTSDPVFDDLQRMFGYFEGPPNPTPIVDRRATRRRATLRRLGIAVGVATLLLGVSVAGARQLELFDGQPAPEQVRSQIAADSTGAPPALDPGIEAGKTVAMISLPVPQGTATLYVSPAKNATYCMGVSFSWLGGKAALGCSGPGGPVQPIDIGLFIPGRVGTSSIFIYGHVQNKLATTAQIKLADGSTKSVTLAHGFFLSELDPTADPTSVEARDSQSATIATEVVPTHP